MSETGTSTKSESSKPAPSESDSGSGSKENTAIDPERQKNVTKSYRNNWNKIFGKK